MNWFPEEVQLSSAKDDYMEFKEGDNKFRVLSRPISGWEEWLDKTPFRYTINEKPKFPKDPANPPKIFVAFIVWNYGLERIQILMLKQATVMKPIQSLCADSDWGNPCYYDIKVNKKGEGKETKYLVSPSPHKPVTDAIKEAFYAKPCNLNALYVNDAPFNSLTNEITPSDFEGEAGPVLDECINDTESQQLIDAIDGDSEYLERILKAYKISHVSKLPKAQFSSVLQKVQSYQDLKANPVPF